MKTVLLIVLSAISAFSASTQVSSMVVIAISLLAFGASATHSFSIAAWCVAIAPMFIGQAVVGVPAIVVISGGLCLGLFYAELLRSTRDTWHVESIPLLATFVIVIGAAIRPPISVEGEFAVLEQSVIFVLMVYWMVVSGGFGEDLNQRTLAFHVGLCGVAIVSGVSSWQALNTATSVEVASRQVAGVFGASNYVSALLTVCAVACLHYALTGVDRVVNIFMVLLMITLSIPHASRTSSAALLIVTGAMLIRRTGFSIPTLALVVATFAGSVGISRVPVIARLQDPSSGLDSLNGRVELWTFGWDIFSDSPLIGIGGGRLTDALIGAGYPSLYLHNLVVSMLAQYGILGILMLLTFAWPVLRGSSWSYPWVTAGTLLLISLVEPAVETMKIGILFAALVGISVRNFERSRKHDLSNRRSLRKDFGAPPVREVSTGSS